MTTSSASRFAELHRDGLFVMPNPWDVGSARILAAAGFQALATTSSGHAASMGRHDQKVSRDELLAHTEAIAAATDVPLNVDAERCFADTPEGVAATVRLIAHAGAAGCSIEDYDPVTGATDELGVAVERVAAAAEAANDSGMVLTARADHHLYQDVALEDTILRLRAYHDAGAHVVYAPGLTARDDIERLVNEVSAPVNVLALPGGPSIGELASAGVRRVSTGGALALAAYGALHDAAQELLGPGTTTYANRALSGVEQEAAFGS